MGRWIGTHHKQDNPRFTKERIAKLEAIGMVWDVKEAHWKEMYVALQIYSQQYCSARVPQSYISPDGKKLGIWLNQQRMEYKKGRLPDERKILLENLDVIWNPETLRRESWHEKYCILKEYTKSHQGRLSSMQLYYGGRRKTRDMACKSA